MTTTRKLTELFRALATENLRAAISVAGEICKMEEDRGHRTAARALRGALSASDKGASVRAQSQRPNADETQSFLSTGLVRLQDTRGLVGVTLAPRTRAQLDSVIAEWKY